MLADEATIAKILAQPCRCSWSFLVVIGGGIVAGLLVLGAGLAASALAPVAMGAMGAFGATAVAGGCAALLQTASAALLQPRALLHGAEMGARAAHALLGNTGHGTCGANGHALDLADDPVTAFMAAFKLSPLKLSPLSLLDVPTRMIERTARRETRRRVRVAGLPLALL